MSTLAMHTTPHASVGRPTFPRVLRSEWIKLRTLRSTFWTLVSVLVLIVGLPALTSAFITDADGGGAADEYVAITANAGLMFAALAVAVLGVLAISGEFSTGMIRSSFAAAPNRLSVVIAKAVVLFATSFIVGVMGFTVSWAITAAVMEPKGYNAHLFTDSTLWSIVGAAAYIGLVAVFALGLGAILKASAGGIATALGVLFLLPIISQLLHQLLRQPWVADWSLYLLNSVGSGMSGQENGLEPWQNILTLLIWTAASFIFGAILLKRRNV